MIDQKCEVHAFDPNMYEEEEGERENGVKFHKVGIGSRSADGVLQEIALSNTYFLNNFEKFSRTGQSGRPQQIELDCSVRVV